MSCVPMPSTREIESQEEKQGILPFGQLLASAERQFGSIHLS
jgi:hypothetical protein